MLKPDFGVGKSSLGGFRIGVLVGMSMGRSGFTLAGVYAIHTYGVGGNGMNWYAPCRQYFSALIGFLCFLLGALGFCCIVTILTLFF